MTTVAFTMNEVTTSAGQNHVGNHHPVSQSLRRSTSNPCNEPVSGMKDFNRERTDSIGSKGSGSGTSEGELKDLQVVLRKKDRNLANGNSDDTRSVDSAERRDQELLRRRSASVLEVKERAHSRLREELLRAQKDLKLKDEQCQELSKVQDKMGVELEDLTASLFEEANKMVQDAHVRRMQAEKFLKESNAKIEVLQAEVTALKTLVITSTPSMPNRHLHPQIGVKKPVKAPEFVKGHRRSTSHHNFTKEISPTATEIQFTQPVQMTLPDEREIDPIHFREFQKWRESPSLDRTNPFLTRIIQEEVSPCLTFASDELAKSVFKCVLSNTLMIEPVPEKNPFPRKCALTQTTRACKYTIRLGDAEPCHYISQLARNRITAVCDFITYIRYITQGLVKSESNNMYWEILRLRKQMALAKLGLS